MPQDVPASDDLPVAASQRPLKVIVNLISGEGFADGLFDSAPRERGFHERQRPSRVFRKPDETWSETDSFDDRDLPALAKAANDAHTWIHAAKARGNATNGLAEEDQAGS